MWKRVGRNGAWFECNCRSRQCRVKGACYKQWSAGTGTNDIVSTGGAGDGRQSWYLLLRAAHSAPAPNPTHLSTSRMRRLWKRKVRAGATCESVPCQLPGESDCRHGRNLSQGLREIREQ